MQRIPLSEEYRNVRFASEHPPQSYIPQTHHRIQQGPPPREFVPQPVYREQYIEQDRQFVPQPLHHSSLDQLPIQRPTQTQQQVRPVEQYQELDRKEPSQWPVRSDEHQQASMDQDDLEDDSRTVIMAPAASRLKPIKTHEESQSDQREHFPEQEAEGFPASFEQYQDTQQQQQHVSFHNDHATEPEDHSYEKQLQTDTQQQEAAKNNEEAHQHYSEEQYQRKQSLHIRSQPLSTEDSGALSGKDKLGPEDTDVFQSRETHEESDRLGPRTTEDDVSRTEEHHHHHHHNHTDGEDEDSDSGIGKDGTALRLKKSNLMEKKSLFTIAYDGMQTRGLKSAGDRDDSP